MKKYIYKISYFIMAILLLTGLSCERDTNGPLPDEGMTEAAVSYVVFDAATTDVLIDLVNVDAFHLDYQVGTLWEPAFSKIQIVVAYNGAYDTPYVVVDNITSVPGTGIITMADIVAAVPALSSSADVAEADEFHFYTHITLSDGRVFKMYDKIGDDQGVLMIGSGLVTALASVEGIVGTSVRIPVPCAFVKADYLGTDVDCYDGGLYKIEVIERADLSTATTLVLEMRGLQSGVTDPADVNFYSSFLVTIDLKTFFLSADDQLVITGDNAFGYGLGRVWYEDFRNWEFNTCQQYIKFHVVAGLNDTGYWWGPNWPVFWVGPGAVAIAAAKKTDEPGSGSVLRGEPVKR